MWMNATQKCNTCHHCKILSLAYGDAYHRPTMNWCRTLRLRVKTRSQSNGESRRSTWPHEWSRQCGKRSASRHSRCKRSHTSQHPSTFRCSAKIIYHREFQGINDNLPSAIASTHFAWIYWSRRLGSLCRTANTCTFLLWCFPKVLVSIPQTTMSKRCKSLQHYLFIRDRQYFQASRESYQWQTSKLLWQVSLLPPETTWYPQKTTN